MPTQSKLPVRIKNKLEENKCCCNRFFELMIENPSDAYCSFCTRKGTSLVELHKINSSLQFNSRSSQTETSLESERKSLNDVRAILVKINLTLEAILNTLQDKKEFLYNKLQEECAPCKRTKVFFSKNKTEKFKKKNNQLPRKFSYGGVWPDISRLAYIQPCWLKDYMQTIAIGLAQHESNIHISPKIQSWIFTTTQSSCQNINYFQPMGNLLGRRKIIDIPITRSPALLSFGQGYLAEKQRKYDSEKSHIDIEEEKHWMISA